MLRLLVQLMVLLMVLLMLVLLLLVVVVIVLVVKLAMLQLPVMVVCSIMEVWLAGALPHQILVSHRHCIQITRLRTGT